MEVRINGELIDSGGALIAISKQGFDFSDLKKRFLGRTNRFSLPKTTTNRRIFKAPDVINSGADSFERFYNVTVEDQGVVLLKGVGFLDESSKDYKLQVVDGAKLLFDAMSAKLKDLNLSSSDFIFSNASYLELYQYLDNDSIWIWPFDTQFINNDYTFSNWANNITWSRPHIRIDKLIEASLAAQGWTIEGLASLDIDKYAISSNHDNFIVTGYEALLSDTVTTGDIMDTIAASVFIAPSYYADGGAVGMPGNATSYRMVGNISASSDFVIRVTSTSDPLGTDIVISEFYVSENDTFIDFITDDFKTEEAENRVRFTCEGTGTLTFDNVKIYSRIEEDSFGDLSGGTFNVGVLDGYLVKVFENIPDITQLDLLKEVWTLAAFNFDINQTTKTINIYSIANISRVNSVDWSDKFIIDSETIGLSKAKLGKKTFLNYSNDDTVTPGAGETFFEVDNDTLKGEETYLNSAFSASDTVDFLESPIPGSETPVAVMRIYNETARENSVTLRIKYIRDVSALGRDWKTEALFIPLSFATLKNTKYNTIIEALQKGRYIKADFNLSKLDVVGVDFSKSVYIEHLKSYFILANTGNYIPGQLTTCELLKIN